MSKEQNLTSDEQAIVNQLVRDVEKCREFYQHMADLYNRALKDKSTPASTLEGFAFNVNEAHRATLDASMSVRQYILSLNKNHPYFEN